MTAAPRSASRIIVIGELQDAAPDRRLVRRGRGRRDRQRRRPVAGRRRVPTPFTLHLDADRLVRARRATCTGAGTRSRAAGSSWSKSGARSCAVRLRVLAVSGRRERLERARVVASGRRGRSCRSACWAARAACATCVERRRAAGVGAVGEDDDRAGADVGGREHRLGLRDGVVDVRARRRSCGVVASAAAICGAEVVSGSTTVVLAVERRSRRAARSGCAGRRRPARPRSRPRSARPSCCSSCRRTSTTPNVFFDGLARRARASRRRRALPFSVTLTSPARQRAAARQREHVASVPGRPAPSPRSRCSRRTTGRCAGRAGEHARRRATSAAMRSESLHRPAVPTAAAPSSGSRAWKRPSGSATPRFSNFCEEGRPQTGGAEAADDRAVARHLVDLELEQLLQRDHVGLHPLHLGDRGDAAGAVLEPLEVDDAGRAPTRPAGGSRAAAGRSRPSAPSSRRGRARRAGVFAWIVESEPSWPVFIAWSMSSASAPRTSPTMIRSGRMRSELRTSVADRDLALALDVLRARLEPQHVALVEPELGRVLDRDDPLLVRDRRRERVQQRRLAGAGTARDQDVQLRLDAALRGTRPSPG